MDRMTKLVAVALGCGEAAQFNIERCVTSLVNPVREDSHLPMPNIPMKKSVAFEDLAATTVPSEVVALTLQ